MVEAKHLKKGRKNEEEKKGGKRRWGWAAIGAVLMVLVALAVASKYPENKNSCRCAQVGVSFLVSLLDGSSKICFVRDIGFNCALAASY